MPACVAQSPPLISAGTVVNRGREARPPAAARQFSHRRPSLPGPSKPSSNGEVHLSMPCHRANLVSLTCGAPGQMKPRSQSPMNTTGRMKTISSLPSGRRRAGSGEGTSANGLVHVQPVGRIGDFHLKPGAQADLVSWGTSVHPAKRRGCAGGSRAVSAISGSRGSPGRWRVPGCCSGPGVARSSIPLRKRRWPGLLIDVLADQRRPASPRLLSTAPSGARSPVKAAVDPVATAATSRRRACGASTLAPGAVMQTNSGPVDPEPLIR